MRTTRKQESGVCVCVREAHVNNLLTMTNASLHPFESSVPYIKEQAESSIYGGSTKQDCLCDLDPGDDNGCGLWDHIPSWYTHQHFECHSSSHSPRQEPLPHSQKSNIFLAVLRNL